MREQASRRSDGPARPRPPRLRRRSVGSRTDADGHELGRRAEHADRRWSGLDLSGVAAPSMRLDRCSLRACDVDGLDLRDSILDACRLEDCSGATVTATDAHWRDVDLTGPRLGVLALDGATLDGVAVRGGRLHLLNLRGATLVDVVLEQVTIEELDLSMANVRRVSLHGCRVGTLVLHEAELADVDLTGATLGRVDGLRHLAGAALRPTQLLELTVPLALELGIVVVHDG